MEVEKVEWYEVNDYTAEYKKPNKIMIVKIKIRTLSFNFSAPFEHLLSSSYKIISFLVVTIAVIINMPYHLNIKQNHNRKEDYNPKEFGPI